MVQEVDSPAKKGRMEVPELDPALEQAVQFRCQVRPHFVIYN